MNRQQAQKLFTLITTVRHVKEMDGTSSPFSASIMTNAPACILAEGMRHGLYTLKEVEDKSGSNLSVRFYEIFGCSYQESRNVIFGCNTGESTYQAGKELLEKYGYGDLFKEKPQAKPFSEIMAELKGETITWQGKDIPVTGTIG